MTQVWWERIFSKRDGEDIPQVWWGRKFPKCNEEEIFYCT
jgi:hypothetical protein